MFQSGGGKINRTNNRNTYSGRNKLWVYVKSRLPSKTKNSLLLMSNILFGCHKSSQRNREEWSSFIPTYSGRVFHQCLWITQSHQNHQLKDSQQVATPTSDFKQSRFKLGKKVDLKYRSHSWGPFSALWLMCLGLSVHGLRNHIWIKEMGLAWKSHFVS